MRDGGVVIPEAYVPARERSETRVQVVEGPPDSLGDSFVVGEAPITIGYGTSCEIRLPEAPGFAREHARVWSRDGKLMLHHLAIGAETRLTDRSVMWASLDPGDRVTLGPYRLLCIGAVTEHQAGNGLARTGWTEGAAG